MVKLSGKSQVLTPKGLKSSVKLLEDKKADEAKARLRVWGQGDLSFLTKCSYTEQSCAGTYRGIRDKSILSCWKDTL